MLEKKLPPLLLLLCFLGVFSTLQAQTTYQTPPKVIADLVNAPITPSVVFSKKGDWMMLLERAGNPSIEDLAQPELRIAGLRINPTTSGPSRRGSVENLKIKMTRGGEEIQIKGLPANPRMGGFSLSGNDKFLAFTQTEPTGISLWVVDMASFEARQLTENILNEVIGGSLAWTPDNQILIKAVKSSRKKFQKPLPLLPDPLFRKLQEMLLRVEPIRIY